VPRLRTRVEVVFLRHASERDRLTNTGHWAALALEGSAVLEQGLPGVPLDASALCAPGTWLLFPSPHPPPASAEPPRRIVVPDGTWPQARRMVQRVPALRALPRLPLPPAPPAARLRRTVRGGMSTLEALVAALRALGEPDAAARLDDLLAAGVELATRLRGGPGAGPPEPRPSRTGTGAAPRAGER
jgi:DTW domain-containing protein YfiP